MKTEMEQIGKNKQVLFIQRDSLVESIRIRGQEIKELRENFEEMLEPKKKHLNKLIELIREVRYKLYELGVDAEDC